MEDIQKRVYPPFLYGWDFEYFTTVSSLDPRRNSFGFLETYIYLNISICTPKNSLREYVLHTSPILKNQYESPTNQQEKGAISDKVVWSPTQDL